MAGEEVEYSLSDKPLLLDKRGSKLACDDFKLTQHLLTKEELIRIDREEPIWRKIRISVLVLFFLIWIGLLAAAVLIITFVPKCPPQKHEEFWNKNVGYWIDPFAFRDSDDDRVGDLKGLESSVKYIKNQINAGYIILGSMFSGYFTNKNKKLGQIDDFNSLDPVLGSNNDLRSLIRTFRKHGIEVVMSMPFNNIYTKSAHFNSSMVRKRNSNPTRDSSKMDVYYSTFSKMTDLDVTKSSVVEYVKIAMGKWLDMGLSGILLPDAAFYAATTGDSGTWFTSYPKNQLYTDDGLVFIQKIREFIDKYSYDTGKKKLFAVEAGNIGWAISTQTTINSLLGNADKPGAHLVISKEFVYAQGAKSSNSSDRRGTISTAVKNYKNSRDIAFTLATPSDKPYADLISLSSTFLLPGSPIIYYGTELGLNSIDSTTPPKDFYPKGHSPILNLIDDTEMASHLPMQWDESGKKFSLSGNYSGNAFYSLRKKFSLDGTVEAAMSTGQPLSIFDLIKKFVKLRDEKSIRWGNVTWINQPSDDMASEDHIQIFKRKSEGYPSFIVALLRNPVNAAVFIDFTSICKKNVKPRIVYPENKYLPEGTIFKVQNVNLNAAKKDAVYVFECTSDPVAETAPTGH